MSSDAAQYFPGVLKERIGSDCAAIEKLPISAIETQRNETAGNKNPTTDTSVHVASLDAGLTNVSDEILMEGICAADKEALAQLFRRYARLVRTVAYRILRDGAEADDLLQELFLFINRKCASFDSSRGSARSWIVQMTYHLAIDRRRYLSSRHFYTQVDIDGPAMEVPDPRGDVLPYDQSKEGVLGRTGLEKLEKSLSGDQWTTMQLYFFEGFTIEEIAVRLGQSPGNVRNHYYRGLEKVRKQMLSKKLRAD